MKKLAMLAALLLLAGCEPHTSVNRDFAVPPELKDCKFFDMYDGSNNAIVVRCPNSDVSVSRRVSCGKNCWRTENTMVVEDGN